jgi:hypothetical protein
LHGDGLDTGYLLVAFYLEIRVLLDLEEKGYPQVYFAYTYIKGVFY